MHETALHLPLDDPYQAPERLPDQGRHQVRAVLDPGSDLYDDARAEIWFASEEFARTNGFVERLATVAARSCG